MPAQLHHALTDGLAVFGHLVVAGEALGCRPLARQMGMDAARMNRLLQGLVASGYARRNQQRRYEPGPALPVLAALALHGSPLLRRADPLLRQLQDSSGCSPALGMLWQDTVVYLWHSGGPGASRAYPAHASSIGCLLLHSPHQQSLKQRHGDHYSLSVRVPGLAHGGLALTDIPLLQPLPPLRRALKHCAQQIMESANA